MSIPTSGRSIRWILAAGTAATLFALLFISDRLSFEVSGQATIPNATECRNGITVPNSALNSGLVADCDVLWAIRNELGTASLWTAATAVRNWPGITVEAVEIGGTPRSRVTKIIFIQQAIPAISAPLGGILPARLENLPQLTSITITANGLTGSIPTGFGNLSELQYLVLNNNNLTGSIPSELGSLSRLRQLSFTENNLTGTIPTELGNATDLDYIHLNSNNLTGPIPTSFGNLTKVEHLILSGNNLTGPIPTELQNMTLLNRLYLTDNQLSGEFPDWIVDLEHLDEFSIERNLLTGHLPVQNPFHENLERAIIGEVDTDPGPDTNTWIGCVPSWATSIRGIRGDESLPNPLCGSPAAQSIWMLDHELPSNVYDASWNNATTTLALRATYTIPAEYAATDTSDSTKLQFRTLAARTSGGGTITVSVARSDPSANAAQYVGFDTRAAGSTGSPTSSQLSQSTTVSSNSFTCSSVASQEMEGSVILPDPIEVVCETTVDIWVIAGADAESPYDVSVVTNPPFNFTAILNGSDSISNTVGVLRPDPTDSQGNPLPRLNREKRKNWGATAFAAQGGTEPPTPTPTNTPEPVPPTNTPEPVPPTNTPEPVPPTNTPEPVPPTNTPEPVPPTNTPEPPTPRPTNTPEPTWTPEPTNTPVPAPNDGGGGGFGGGGGGFGGGGGGFGGGGGGPGPATATPTPTPTPTPTFTPFPTNTPAPTATATPTATGTPTSTATPTVTPTPTNTALPTNTPFPTNTPVPTNTPQPTDTPEPEPTPTFTPEATWTNTPVPTLTPTPADTPTPSAAVATVAPRATNTRIPTRTPTPTPPTQLAAQVTVTAAPTNTPLPAATATPAPPPEEAAETLSSQLDASDEQVEQAIREFERRSTDDPEGAATVLLTLAQTDDQKAARVLFEFEDRDVAASVLLALAGEGTATAATMVLNMYFWADGPEGVVTLLTDSASTDAESVGRLLLEMSGEDDVVTASVTTSLAQADEDLAGSVILGAAQEDGVMTASIVCLAARTNAESIGRALARSAAQDASGIAGVFDSVQSNRNCVSDLGSVTPVDAWMPENPPQEGSDAVSGDGWRDIGSPPPIDNILARFPTNFPDGAYTDIVSVLDRLSDFADLPEGSVVYDALDIQPQEFTSDDTPAAHVTMFIDRQWLTANQVHEWSMQFSRYDESTSTWVPTQAKRARADATNVYFTVTVPGFSIWAVHGSTNPPQVRFVESNLRVTPATIEPGGETTVSVDVTNQTDEQATYFANLWVGGQINRVEEYPVRPNDTITIELPLVVAAEGTHPIRVGNQISEQPLVVQGAAPPTTDEPDEAAGTSSTLLIVGGLLLAGAVAIGAGFVFLRIRRQTQAA